MNACKYYYLDGQTEKLINSDYCECSLMEEKNSNADDIDPKTLPRLNDGNLPIPRQKILKGRGHCPFPDQSIIDKYVKSMKNISGESVGILHTNDRNNKVAQLELLVKTDAIPIDISKLVMNETWANQVTSYF